LKYTKAGIASEIPAFALPNETPLTFVLGDFTAAASL